MTSLLPSRCVAPHHCSSSLTPKRRGPDPDPSKFPNRPLVRTPPVAAGRPKRRSAAPASGGLLEPEELVRTILKKSSGEEKQQLVATLSKYVKAVRTEHCFLLFEELGKRDRWLQCLEMDGETKMAMYSKLISVMGKKGQTRMAMWFFSDMSSGCRPDTSVYNALITAHLHSRDKAKVLAKASGYFEKMKGMERCQPNTLTYNILLRAYAQAGDVEQVEALFKDLDSSIISLIYIPTMG